MGTKTEAKIVLSASDKTKAAFKSANKNLQSTSKNLSSMQGVITTAVGGAGIGLLATKWIQSSIALEKLNQRLIIATGSTERASNVFGAMRNLAAEMPGSVDDLTEAYLKLTDLGLNPSREALISYGNTAAAQGKNLNQLIEAVADAATGEFERLKEFGIKARSEGDNVSFTFRGVETTVKKSSNDIQNYLLEIGNTAYAGSLARQNDTLGGAFEDLAESISNATLALSDESGFNSALKTFTQNTALGIRSLTGTQTMGDVETSIKNITAQIEEHNKKIADARQLASQDRTLWEQLTGPSVDAIIKSSSAQLGILNEQLAKMQAKMGEINKQNDALTDKNKEEQESAVDKVGYGKFDTELQKISDSLMSKEALQLEHFDKMRFMADGYHLDNQLSEADHEKAITDINKAEATVREKLAKAEHKAKIAIATGAFDNLASLMSSDSKELFEIGKVAAISSATIKGYEAVVSAYAAGNATGGGPIVGAAYATTAAIAVGAQIASIARTQFGGGGSVTAEGGGSPGTAPIPTPPALQQAQDINVTVRVEGNLSSIVTNATAEADRYNTLTA